MSQLIFSASVRPAEEAGFRPTNNLRFRHFSDLVEVPVAHVFPGQERDLVALPDPRSYRTLSRAGLILFRCIYANIQAIRNHLSLPGERIGLYCALDTGPLDYESIQRAESLPAERVNEFLLAGTPPKQSFKNGQNFVGAQLAIDLGIRGPFNTYSHGRFGCLHALMQAEGHLNAGVIDLALVFSAFSLEDPLQTAKTLMDAPAGCVLSEGAGLVILKSDSNFLKWELEFNRMSTPATGPYFGISHPLMNYILGK